MRLAPLPHGQHDLVLLVSSQPPIALVVHLEHRAAVRGAHVCDSIDVRVVQARAHARALLAHARPSGLFQNAQMVSTGTPIVYTAELAQAGDEVAILLAAGDEVGAHERPPFSRP